MTALAADSIGKAPGEFPVLVPVRDEHVRLAVRAVVTHAPQESASGEVPRDLRTRPQVG